ncbi:Sucrose transport protein SUT2 [Platanthera guangdongensis]|uniref:Sucrose transport protein SUT2 n=1 Tax=Platanthera guangdongensis TaxID=2320717 RepID=A0ABR2LDB3_9ASPA
MASSPHEVTQAPQPPPPANSRPRSSLSSAAEAATTSGKNRIKRAKPPLPPPPPPLPLRREARVPLRLLLKVTSVACGVQFGWALQLSLLTPYVQELGIPHSMASLVWLCGPLSGLFVQPLIGHMSDRCASRFGRRRPFILGGAAVIALSIVLIGFAADIGGIMGDPAGAHVRPRAIAVFVVGFWLLDVGNNTIQGPCRALLADLTGKDHRRTRVANAYYSLFMALGSVLGYAAGSFSAWFKILPFTFTSYCNRDCANLKSVFLVDVLLLALTTYFSVSSVKEIPLNSRASSNIDEETPAQEAFFWELLGVFRYVTSPIWIILIATALNWIGWFPFTLFDTDWMGREIYRGDPNKGQGYHTGVRMGAFGLMMNSIVLGFTSIMLEKICRKFGSGLVWGISSIVLSFCLGAMLIITAIVKDMEFSSKGLPPTVIVVAALFTFTVLGMPLAITYSLPYALISARTEALGLGQGLSMGILNLAIVIPQVCLSYLVFVIS